MIPHPQPDEASSYYQGYIARITQNDVLAVLESQRQELIALLEPISEEKALEHPAPGEWNIKEVLGHLCDAERIFSYRALRFSRKDTTPLPGFEQEQFTRESHFSELPLSDLLAEFNHLRSANILMFKSFTPEQLKLRGIASENEVSVRALVYIIAGHCDDHLVSLKTKYVV
jgi:hypothetical protein